MKATDRTTCYFCGKFISFKRALISWTPFGGATDTEPPDSEYSHKKCYLAAPKHTVDLITATSWHKPSNL